MKKRNMKKAALAGSMLLTASLLSGCFGPNMPAAEYGPPRDYEIDPDPTPFFDPEDNIPAPVYGPAPDYELEFDPALNEPESVYGPPSLFGFEDEDENEDEKEDGDEPELTVTGEEAQP